MELTVKELLKKLQDLDAYLVAKNIFCRCPSEKQAFIDYVDLALRMASFDIEFEERKEYLNEASGALTIFSEKAIIDEDVLRIIRLYENRIHEVFCKINETESEFLKELKIQAEEKNNKALSELEILNTQIGKAKSQVEFDELVAKVSKIESSINKEAFTDTQQETYEVLTRCFSDTISRTMEDINRINLIELNKNAANSFRLAYDSFMEDKTKFKNSESNLHALVITTLFAYDSRDLLNETMIYYNYVYSVIFNEVSDDLKFKLTEWSIGADKIKR